MKRQKTKPADPHVETLLDEMNSRLSQFADLLRQFMGKDAVDLVGKDAVKPIKDRLDSLEERMGHLINNWNAQIGKRRVMDGQNMHTSLENRADVLQTRANETSNIVFDHSKRVMALEKCRDAIDKRLNQFDAELQSILGLVMESRVRIWKIERWRLGKAPKAPAKGPTKRKKRKPRSRARKVKR